MGRDVCVIGPIYLLTKPKERQNNTGRQQGEGWGEEGGTSAGMYDMCMCANLYKYHNKKHDVAAPAAKRRKWAPGVGVQGFWVFSLFSFFFVCVVISLFFTLFRWLVGFKIGVKALPPHCSLATAQHLCSALVSFVNPGLVGVGLEETNTGPSNCCVKPNQLQ